MSVCPDSTVGNRRRHDLEAALRTLEMAIDRIRDGYQFNDDGADEKVDAMARAVEILRRESGPMLSQLLKVKIKD